MLKRALINLFGRPLPVRMMRRVMNPYALRVVCYHSVAKEHPFLPRHLYVTPACLKRHIQGLCRAFNIVSFDDMERVRSGEILFPVMITFDDGLVDNYRAAFPVLKECGVKATFFINALPFEDPGEWLWTHSIYFLDQHLGTRRLAMELALECSKCPPSASLMDIISCIRIHGHYAEIRNRLHRLAVKFKAASHFGQLYLDKKMVRTLLAAGMEIGSHGHAHFDISRCENIEEESVKAKAVIEQIAGVDVRCFAYPFGDRNSLSDYTHTQLHGQFDCLCTTEPKVNTPAGWRSGIIDRVCAYEMPEQKLLLKLLFGI